MTVLQQSRRSFISPWLAKNALLLLMSFIAMAAMLGACLFGPMDISLGQWWQAIVLRDDATGAAAVVWQLRLPRVLIAFMVGGGLAIAGAAIQGMVRNPLADPGLIGITSGAMLFAALAMVLVGDWPLGVASSAFIGSLLTMMLVMKLAGKQSHIMSMILAGLVISSLAGAVVGLMNYLADDNQLRALTFWTMGSLANSHWQDVAILLPITVVSVWVLHSVAIPLNALLLGEDAAQQMGVNVLVAKRKVMIAATLMVGVSVAMTGLIGFVGLMIPHLVRFFTGANHQRLLPISFMLGGSFLVLCDVFARTLAVPAEVPIGLITSLIGAPFFIYLLLQARRRGQLLG